MLLWGSWCSKWTSVSWENSWTLYFFILSCFISSNFNVLVFVLYSIVQYSIVYWGFQKFYKHWNIIKIVHVEHESTVSKLAKKYKTIQTLEHFHCSRRDSSVIKEVGYSFWGRGFHSQQPTQCLTTIYITLIPGDLWLSPTSPGHRLHVARRLTCRKTHLHIK